MVTPSGCAGQATHPHWFSRESSHRDLKVLRFFTSMLAGLSVGLVTAPALDLAGEWRLRLDPEDVGLRANWPAAPLATDDRIPLPNTTDLAGFGFALDTNTMRHAAPFPATTRFPGVKEPARADEHGYLVRRHLFVGPAWYERDVEIPTAWQGCRVRLRLERALWKTGVWINGRHAGECDSLVAEHRYDLGLLAPGRHRLTVRVDNRMIHNITTVTHAYGPETQSRWNGLVGALTLEAVAPVAVESLDVFPAPDRQSVRVRARVRNATDGPVQQNAEISLENPVRSGRFAVARVAWECPPGESTHEAVLADFSAPVRAWDEFNPVLYQVRVSLVGAEPVTTAFGFRHVERVGRELRLNGRPIFLRGTLDCAVYPRTGHPPMTVPEWERILGVVKEYGFNHVRFHTWCPPRAAFVAADRLGVYLQPETAAWIDDWGTETVTRPVGIGRDPQVTDFLRAELRRMSEAYGNHPSFLLCAIGNEFGMKQTDWDRVNAMVEEIRTFDPRRLYTGCGARRNLPADDFWFTHNSGVGTRGIGPAHTDWDFARAYEASPVPLIAHETGQRPVFPDYDTLLPKFTGPLLPLNLERFRRALAANGLAPQAPDFVRASARFQLTQYKAEHEAMLRTRGYAGYQLLMLNDFTGQAEALVGILDPFWESKGVVTAAEVRAWNAPTVPLARFPKFVWTEGEEFRSRIEVAHFGGSDLAATALEWALRDTNGLVVAGGRLEAPEVRSGGVTGLGEIRVALTNLAVPAQLRLHLRIGSAENQWPLWVYAAAPVEPEPPSVLVARKLDEAARQRLREGGRVLLLAHGLKNPYTARTAFESVYWSAGWWGNRFSSLGLLCDPAHPAFAEFPNEGVSDWQWHGLLAGATTFDLTGAPAALRPLVQPVPDFHNNTRLGQVFEGRVGAGALLVCGYDVQSRLEERPAARQFRRSLFRYAAGEAFRPAVELPPDWIASRLQPAGLAAPGATVSRVSSEDVANGHRAANVLDGDPATFWHTRWQPQPDPPPHELVIDLGRAREFSGLTFVPRQDQSNGRIARADVFVSLAADAPGERVGELRSGDTVERLTLRFARPVQARFLRLVVAAEVNNRPFAALAELDILTETNEP